LLGGNGLKRSAGAGGMLYGFRVARIADVVNGCPRRTVESALAAGLRRREGIRLAFGDSGGVAPGVEARAEPAGGGRS